MIIVVCEFDEIRIEDDIDEMLRTSKELYWQDKLLYQSVYSWICYPKLFSENNYEAIWTVGSVDFLLAPNMVGIFQQGFKVS